VVGATPGVDVVVGVVVMLWWGATPDVAVSPSEKLVENRVIKITTGRS
jgi:hypothetical protein